MQEMNKPSYWQAFVSLAWYDGLISFLFRFVSKTAEPLLAAGVIVSAADFLQKGQLMSHNPMLASAWTWTQALAIEASTGPVLVFALQAFRERDKSKGVLYLILAALLFVVGGAMLLLQLLSNAYGVSEASINSIVLFGLFVLRVVVTAGMIALSCTKHMRFSGLFHEPPAPAPMPAPQIDMDALFARLEESLEHRIEGVYQRIDFRIEQATTNPQIPAIALANAPARAELPEEAQSLVAGKFASKKQEVARVLQANPGASVEDVMQAAQCSRRTAEKWMAKYEQR